MRTSLLLAIVAGLASGLLNLSAAVASPLSVMLYSLTHLPLFLAGLGLGVSSASIATVAGMLSVGAVVGASGIDPLSDFLLGAASFLALNGLPAMLLTRQGLLSRQGPNGVLWYPSGLLLTWLVGIAFAAFLMLLTYFGLFRDGLLTELHAALEIFIEPFRTRLGEEAARSFMASARIVPGLGAVYFMVVIIVNGVLAQQLLRKAGRNIRPSLALVELELPSALLYVLGVALLLMLFSGTLGLIGMTLAFIVGLAYFLLGLAVVHAFLRNRPNARFALFSFYMMLIFLFLLTVPVALAVVGLGIAEQVIGLRSRFRGAGTNQEEE